MHIKFLNTTIHYYSKLIYECDDFSTLRAIVEGIALRMIILEDHVQCDTNKEGYLNVWAGEYE